MAGPEYAYLREMSKLQDVYTGEETSEGENHLHPMPEMSNYHGKENIIYD